MHETEIPVSTEADFDGLGIAPKLLSILTGLGFKHPTPIQLQAIPIAVTGKDVIGIAQTGTGKTLAFGVPMLQIIAKTKTRGLVLLPTRELAVQVNDHLQKLGRSLGLKTVIVMGGESLPRQSKALKSDFHILIATPGRLIDHMERNHSLLNRMGILILDEADRMLDMGFLPQINRILEKLPTKRQTMLFSATMPAEIVGIAGKYMQLPVRVEVAPPGTANVQISQELFFVHRNDKQALLLKLLDDYKGSVLVFTRTKFGAKKLAQVLRDKKINSAEIHSNRTLPQRLSALEGFKRGTYRVLVATDIAARGIDVKGITLVINYDLPENPSDYVHRIGRTGRASLAGHAISFATPEQKSDVRDIERLLKKALPVAQSHPAPKGGPVGNTKSFSGSRFSGRSFTGKPRAGGYAGSRSNAPTFRPSTTSKPTHNRNFVPKVSPAPYGKPTFKGGFSSARVETKPSSPGQYKPSGFGKRSSVKPFGTATKYSGGHGKNKKFDRGRGRMKDNSALPQSLSRKISSGEGGMFMTRNRNANYNE